MADKIIIVGRGVGNSETAEIPASSLKNWEKLGYKKIGEREPETVVAPKPAAPADAPGGDAVPQTTMSSVLDSVVEPKVIKVLMDAGYDLSKLSEATVDELCDLPLIGKATAKKILAAVE